MYRYKFFVKKSEWEICIFINAEIKKYDPTQIQAQEVYEGVWVSVVKEPKYLGEKLTNKEMAYLIEGVKHDGKTIVNYSKYRKQTWIEIDSVRFSDCYYQEEALYVAMRYWIAHTFSSKEPCVEVEFDKQSNRYLFHNED